jgi:hypothetical protein
MTHPTPPAGRTGPPGHRLETWLVRKIQGGALRALPRYQPLQGRGAECPEQYAQSLLNGLREVRDPQTAERLKDDGRMFRSWVESALPPAPRAGECRLAPNFSF